MMVSPGAFVPEIRHFVKLGKGVGALYFFSFLRASDVPKIPLHWGPARGDGGVFIRHKVVAVAFPLFPIGWRRFFSLWQRLLPAKPRSHIVVAVSFRNFHHSVLTKFRKYRITLYFLQTSWVCLFFQLLWAPQLFTAAAPFPSSIPKLLGVVCYTGPFGRYFKSVLACILRNRSRAQQSDLPAFPGVFHPALRVSPVFGRDFAPFCNLSFPSNGWRRIAVVQASCRGRSDVFEKRREAKSPLPREKEFWRHWFFFRHSFRCPHQDVFAAFRRQVGARLFFKILLVRFPSRARCWFFFRHFPAPDLKRNCWGSASRKRVWFLLSSSTNSFQAVKEGKVK
ncbi:hypothetical protein TRVL_08452 [Trypanosoma vivax]|nr:hypothetical protein TRVL_08452 [Trypanosoma vivax]